MLNAGYNLPSEDCNTEKQMVFHSNKLPYVCSLYIELALRAFFFFCLPLSVALNQTTERRREEQRPCLSWGGGGGFGLGC